MELCSASSIKAMKDKGSSSLFCDTPVVLPNANHFVSSPNPFNTNWTAQVLAIRSWICLMGSTKIRHASQLQFCRFCRTCKENTCRLETGQHIWLSSHYLSTHHRRNILDNGGRFPRSSSLSASNQRCISHKISEVAHNMPGYVLAGFFILRTLQ